MKVLIQPELRGETETLLDVRTEILTLEECIEALRPVLDSGGWQKLEDLQGERRIKSRTRQGANTLVTTKTRTDRIVILSNGINTIHMLDWTEKTKERVIHDPEIRIVGPDALDIYNTLRDNIITSLMDRAIEVSVVVNDKVVRELGGLLNKFTLMFHASSIGDDIEREAKLRATMELMRLTDKPKEIS